MSYGLIVPTCFVKQIEAFMDDKGLDYQIWCVDEGGVEYDFISDSSVEIVKAYLATLQKPESTIQRIERLEARIEKLEEQLEHLSQRRE